MKIIISEKAIAGANIASILAGKKISASRSGAAQVFPFSSKGEEFLVIPLRGHIVDVEFPKKYSYWVGTDLKELVDAPVDYSGTEKAIIGALKREATNADEVIIATDADREGESIGVEALNFVKSSNPGIKIKRAYFSAISKSDIDAAFSSLNEVDYNYADSADSRREIDLIWGAVLTRFISLVSGQLGKNFLSVGRVQTPTLAIVVQREKERIAFVSKPYWEIKALFDKDGKEFEADHKKGKFWDEAEARKVMESKSEFGVVKDISSKRRKLNRPIPFNTTAFLRQATSIGFSAGQAMDIAERLYQNGFTSYPRTDNTVYPKSLDLKNILGEMAKVSDFSSDANELLSREKLAASRGPKETKDHPPIYPVTAAPKEKLSDREWKIYELIVRRFFATLADDALTENQSVELLVKEEPFIARGQKIVDPGWKKFYPYSSLSEIFLPAMEKGDKVPLKKMDFLSKETQPPARYSQSSLIKLMEDNNLGTKSTRHNIIQKLYARKYLVGNKAVEPSKVAFAVVDALQKYEVDAVEPEMTAELEKEMDLIAAGNKSKKEVVENSRRFLHKILDKMKGHKDEIGSEIRSAIRDDSIIGKCNKCDGNLIIRKSKRNKRFLGCTNYPKCTNTFPLPQKGKIIPMGKDCEVCGMPVFQLVGKRFKFETCINPDCSSKGEWKKKINSNSSKAKSSEKTQ